MHPSFLIILILLYFTASESKQPSEEAKVQQVIHTVFEAFSSGSTITIEQVVTADVKILEHGEVWTLDTVRVHFKKPRPADFKRINTLEFFQTEITDNMAFVSYYNTANVHVNNKDRVVKWLESAVLVKESEKWKVKMLHSTRIEPRQK